MNLQQVKPLNLRSGKSSVIHVQQFVSQALQGWYGAGYWKDFEGRRLLCEELGISFVRTWFDPADLASAVTMVLPETTDVIVEYSVHLGLLRALRRGCPRLKLHVRAHNAEALQHLDRLPLSFWPTLENARRLYGAARLAMQDRQSALAADSVLGISSYDAVHYWSRLAGKSCLIDVPYFSPWPELRPQVAPQPWIQRKNQIICMPGGCDRFSQQQRTHFIALAEATSAAQRSHLPEFLLTDYTRETAVVSKAVRYLGAIDEPWDLLCESKALAVLTDMGYGMKTTIVDALTAGCRVFVLPGLIPRLPEVVRSFCLPLDPAEPSADQQLTNALQSSSVAMNQVNQQLRRISKDGLKQALKLLR